MAEQSDPTHLHALARENGGRLAKRAAEVDQTSEVRQLVDAEGRLAFNLRASAAEDFLETGRRLNKFTWAEGEATRTNRPVDEILRVSLGEHFGPRLEFEANYCGGGHFYYGALNVGGAGASKYGDYCFIESISPNKGRVPADPVWIGEDSLTGANELFRAAGGDIVEERLAEWVASTHQAGDLTAVKLAYLGLSNVPLAIRICSKDDYIEGVSITPTAREGVEEIRLAKERADEIQNLAFESALSGGTESTGLDLEQHRRVRELADLHGIQWNEV
ncbi:hypothetical protein [Engelhardtia mirabilis]|uniref:Uncharacterized protein n=1 Tax=Engelhardtia mirabilis TaxID=2528011 RepID=A0A518BR45_9BACT|nr:hypothetical protein Pla133_45650 [Planctomycetes bacterium Pla133]QDV03771.1 hypothetical protein Pla86_45630 [Planctomycetes bacterium Pla86]